MADNPWKYRAGTTRRKYQEYYDRAQARSEGWHLPTQAEKAARADAAREKALIRGENIELTAQEILLRNMHPLSQLDGIPSVHDISLMNFDVASRVLTYRPEQGTGPESLLTNFSDGDISAFIHATPAQLSVLQPLLRFYIVNNQGDQEEVYFSDHVDLAQVKRFAADRRATGKAARKTRKTKGSEVGIKSFTWDYNNKHEGDKIISAKLELYFGSMSELVNEHYLNFLFTNGRSSRGKLPPIGEGSSSATKRRIEALKAILEEKSKHLHPGTSPVPPDLPRNDKKEFRQLKVAVGWSIPKGNEATLSTLFDTPKQLKSFIAGVAATQKVILLSLVNYDVNFTQEGPVTLSLAYVGSSDHHMSSTEADILGSSNPGSSASYASQQALIPLKGLAKTGGGNKLTAIADVFPSGYLHYQLTHFATVTASGINKVRRVPVRMDRLKNEADYLSAAIELETFISETVSGGKENKKIERLKAYLKTVDTAFERTRKAVQQQRYSNLMNSLIGEPGSDFSKVFVVYIKEEHTGKLKLRTVPHEARIKTIDETRHRLAKRNAKKSKTGKKEEIIKANRPTFRRSVDGARDEIPAEEMTVPFLRFGDIVLAAMETANIPGDIGFIFGTFLPGKIGVEGYSSAKGKHLWETIYDIPIALEYLSQFVFDNVISRDLNEYPFRAFFDELLTAVTRLMNNITDFKLRISFDYTLYMGYDKIYGAEPDGPNEFKLPSAGPTGPGFGTHVKLAIAAPHIVKPKHLKEAAKNLKNTIYSRAKPIKSYYLLYAKQMSTPSGGNRAKDEKNGIYHYVLGADRGIAKNFNFSKDDTPFFQAMNIEGMTATSNYQALIQPQQISLEMVGNTIHRNGDMIYIDSRAALGTMANEILTLGGYYRVIRSSNHISNRGYTTTIDAKLEHRTHSNG